ncbi:MAG: CRTAC1 family protein [Planctomycetota bacterium]
MARPTNRYGLVDAYGDVDESRREFWVETPWEYPPDKNLSAFEPNVVLWNAGDFRFENLTYVSGAGFRGDGRAALWADIDGDLAPDLILRSSSLGPLRIYRNRFPKQARLIVELEGTDSNRLGLGARMEAHVGERVLVRELFAPNNFIGQQASRVNFGLGSAKKIDRFVLRWPSGHTQEWTDLPVDRHIRIREGEQAIERLR